MSRTAAFFSVLILVACLMKPVHAPGKIMSHKAGYMFVAVTEAYRLGGVRFGHEDTEFGIFPGGLGLGFVYRDKSQPFYGIVAPVLGIYPGSFPPGLNASAGSEMSLFHAVDLRCELSTSWFSNGLFAPFFILGLQFIL